MAGTRGAGPGAGAGALTGVGSNKMVMWQHLKVGGHGVPARIRGANLLATNPRKSKMAAKTFILFSTQFCAQSCALARTHAKCNANANASIYIYMYIYIMYVCMYI